MRKCVRRKQQGKNLNKISLDDMLKMLNYKKRACVFVRMHTIEEIGI